MARQPENWTAWRDISSIALLGWSIELQLLHVFDHPLASACIRRLSTSRWFPCCRGILSEKERARVGTRGPEPNFVSECNYPATSLHITTRPTLSATQPLSPRIQLFSKPPTDPSSPQPCLSSRHPPTPTNIHHEHLPGHTSVST